MNKESDPFWDAPKKDHKCKEKNKIKIIKTIVIILLITVIILLGLKQIKKPIKNLKTVNNNTSQEIEDFIANIKSYEAIIDMEVYSNKNKNKYKIKQSYKNKNDNYQEIIEPSNIKGLKIKKEEEKLIIENSKLNLSKIIEDYNEITSNEIDLITFVNDYKKDDERKIKEEENEVILETKTKSENKYIKTKTLKIDKKTKKPINMEIKSASKKPAIYIIYNEIEINKK